MIKIGLTGGIGTGKSTVSKMFENAGIKVIDADKIAKGVLDKNPGILETIKSEFGSGFFDWTGEFRRKEFGNHIFRFPKQRIKYESIIMPYIMKEIKNEFDDYEKKKEKIVILDAPTLIENKMHTDMDYVILVIAANATQVKRVMERDKLSKGDAVNRINSQMSVEEKKEFANIIIDTNSSDLEVAQKQVDHIVKFFKLIKLDRRK